MQNGSSRRRFKALILVDEVGFSLCRSLNHRWSSATLAPKVPVMG